MKRTDTSLMYVLILFCGVAAGIATPQSWYAGGSAAPAHLVRASLGR